MPPILPRHLSCPMLQTTLRRVRVQRLAALHRFQPWLKVILACCLVLVIRSLVILSDGNFEVFLWGFHQFGLFATYPMRTSRSWSLAASLAFSFIWRSLGRCRRFLRP